MGGTEQELGTVYKTAALPAELIRRPGVFLGFQGLSGNLERAEGAMEE